MKQFKYINFLIVAYVVATTISLILFNKIIDFGPGYISGGICTFPLTYVIADIITEVYGYKQTRQLIWLATFAVLLTALLVTFIIHLPSPAFSHKTQSFNVVFAHALRYSIAGMAAFIISEFINAYVISKWKILVRGKYFWFRSFCATFVGEVTNTILVFTLSFAGIFSSHHLAIMIISMYIYKLSFITLCIIPAVLIVKLLKSKEGIDHYDIGVDFNPFSISLK